MIWLIWRQFRTQIAVVTGVLVLVAIALALTGPDLAHAFDACKATHTCGQVPLSRTDHNLETGLQAVLLLTPALIGIFWGAPLVARELETGTYRLGWTQSITRRRWLGAKLSLVGLVSVVVAGLLSLMLTWWSSPIDTVNANRFGVAMFGLRNITPIGYAAFAFVLGVAAGVLLRRTLPAMASTLVLYIAARLIEADWVRPHLMTPVHDAMAISLGNRIGFSLTPSGLQVVANPPNIANAWVLSSAIVNNAGQAPSASFLQSICPNLTAGAPGVPSGGGAKVHVKAIVNGPPTRAFQQCAAKVAAKFHQVVTYQPFSRFWAFQGIETALFLLLALLLAGLCFWLVRRRLS